VAVLKTSNRPERLRFRSPPVSRCLAGQFAVFQAIGNRMVASFVDSVSHSFNGKIFGLPPADCARPMAPSHV